MGFSRENPDWRPRAQPNCAGQNTEVERCTPTRKAISGRQAGSPTVGSTSFGSRYHELSGEIERLRREGIRLSPKLEWDAFVTAYTLHDEVPLHSYPRRIMPLTRQLREQEERARANISEFDPSTFDKNDAAEELQFRFTTNASLIGDLYLVYIREALTAHEKETLTAEESAI